ncbi:PAS domain-containing protein [Trinickia caryophylli]|uniref:Two-component system, NarL family, sensor histidine kinase UhpB n=1 Tax=Trinickia caryophylli TaxID=28094 RepID=A0A1X7D4G4_TRICW|nr:PAS domain-containing protein [Trinickia caryophylli]PMS12767.1 PAS domain S-box protein [Trinickia caryophylli]TRX15175.1 PAS domain S-box protein [Trinickia caryophylli]WQE15039.1 PAS domain-containing protein [Trinickia caryophylli]SMF08301.1 two-component system, NarL family, sensor histidine kinase UhpB [Trinickia caryophylli]GLU31228.1 sensor kinase [Trinickia caryophylli]
MTARREALRAEYLAALRGYVEAGSETELSRAYEIGRRAMAEGIGLLEMAALHRMALDALVLPAAPADQLELVDAADAFFNELLAPFELSIEGYRAALTASEERFQLAVSWAAAGVWDWNPRTGEVYFSPHFKRIMGYEDDELPNERQAHWGAIHPDDLGRVEQALSAHLDERRSYNVEYRVRTKSGEFRWVHSRGQALWNEAGLAYRMVGWIMDITERKRDEEALRASREELRRLSAHIQHVREEEKARIARELHDDLGQQLTALKMATSLLEYGGGRQPSPPESALKGIYGMIDELIHSVRHIAADLHPPMLQDLGLIPAIEVLADEFAARYRIRVVRHIDADAIAFNRECRIDMYRMVQEALTNVARHSRATEVVLDIVREDPNCIVRIADNGRGATSGGPRARHSFGLLGMRERAALLGGEIRIRTAPGAGFVLTAVLPLAFVEAKV